MSGKIEIEADKLADEIYGLCCDIGRLEVENARLRELVDGLTWCCDHYGCRQECPLYDRSEPDHCRKVSIKRELGMEVNNEGKADS